MGKRMSNAVTVSPSRWARFKNSDFVYYFLRDKVAMFSFAVFVVFVLAALLAPWLAPHNVYDQTSFDLMDAELPPSWLDGGEERFWLGTDNQGRDIWSTILYGARISLSIGLVAVGLQLVLGIVIGLIAGYFGGRIDSLLMRFADVQLSFSTMMVAIIISAIFQATFGSEFYSKFAILMLVVIIFDPNGEADCGETEIQRGQVIAAARKAVGAADAKYVQCHIGIYLGTNIVGIAHQRTAWAVVFAAAVAARVADGRVNAYRADASRSAWSCRR
jgi:ABC-type dipeptide/oligopeptide/nickel transport system permease subunit